MSTVILISFETLAAWFGKPGLKEEHKSKNGVRSLQPPATWVFQLKDRIRMHVLNKVHLFLRNSTATYYANLWVQAPKIRFFSGTPMPRDLTDMSSYLGMLEYSDVGHQAAVNDPSIDYVAGKTNPYLLDDNDSRYKFCFTRYYFDKFIVHPQPITSDEVAEEETSAVAIGKLANKALSRFYIARDYSSACPNGSQFTIFRNMPKLSHHEISIVYLPLDYNLYQGGFGA